MLQTRELTLRPTIENTGMMFGNGCLHCDDVSCSAFCLINSIEQMRLKQQYYHHRPIRLSPQNTEGFSRDEPHRRLRLASQWPDQCQTTRSYLRT